MDSPQRMTSSRESEENRKTEVTSNLQVGTDSLSDHARDGRGPGPAGVDCDEREGRDSCDERVEKIPVSPVQLPLVQARDGLHSATRLY